MDEKILRRNKNNIYIYGDFMKVNVGATWGHNYMIMRPGCDIGDRRRRGAELTPAGVVENVPSPKASRCRQELCVIFGHSH